VLITAFGAAVDPLGSRPFSRLGAVLRLASVIADHRDWTPTPPKACARPRRPWSPTWTWIRRTWPPDCPTTGWPWPAPTR
jgi:hypothetical protein